MTKTIAALIAWRITVVIGVIALVALVVLLAVEHVESDLTNYNHVQSEVHALQQLVAHDIHAGT